MCLDMREEWYPSVHVFSVLHFDPTNVPFLGDSLVKDHILSYVTGEALYDLKGHQSVVRELVFTPTGTLTLVSGSRDKTLRIWDLTSPGKDNTFILLFLKQPLSGVPTVLAHFRKNMPCAVRPQRMGGLLPSIS